MNMQVLNRKGNVVDHTAINFHRYSAASLPYTFRQSTGCDNSLGIIKFNLSSPFSVYMHDTNTKKLFETENRYYSHGCMRVEQAIELGNMLVNNKLDTSYLTSCLKEQVPVTITLENKIPVFVVYDLVSIQVDSTLCYTKDTYNLL
jgi:murein L,D-transpeptidase YcbB/YkuD